MADVFTHDMFAGLRNETFQVQLDANNQCDVDLVEISDLRKLPAQEMFSIVFRGPRETRLGQGIRQFKHDRTGELAIFIVPIREDDKGVYYEAIFNLLPGNQSQLR
jgi:hypothetical protein